MASILQTDVIELFDTWGERVAFNEGYQAQKIADAKQGGRDAFHLGLDRSSGLSDYLRADQAESVDVVGAVDNVGSVDDLGDIEIGDESEVDISALYDTPQVYDVGAVDDVGASGFETIRDNNGEFVRVVNHNSYYDESFGIWDDEKEDFVLA